MDDALRMQVRKARGNFAAMLSTYSLGAFNDNFFKVAVTILAVKAGWDAFRGYATVLFALPFILLAAPSGWLADRFPKRSIVIGAKLLELGAMVCGAVGIVLAYWPLILVMIFLMAAQSAIFSPSLNGSIPELYPDRYVLTANGYVKMFVTCAILAGTALAGVILGLGKGWELLGVPAGRMLIAVSVLTVAIGGVLGSLGVPKRPAANPRAKFPWKSLVDTFDELRRLRRDRLLWTVLLCSVFIWFIGQLQVLVILLWENRQFYLGETRIGLLLGAELLGIGVGGLAAGRLFRGRRWHRPLPIAMLCLSAAMFVVFALPILPAGWRITVLYVTVFLAGIAGGMVLVPCESFIQVRPPAERKGAVIAAANCAAFIGILLAGLVANALNWWFSPTESFGVMAVATAVFAAWVFFALSKGNVLLRTFVKFCLWLRYKIRVRGMDEICRRGRKGILFLPNHPALIDPIIVLAHLNGPFAPRALGDKDQIDRFFIRYLARRAGVVPIPDIAKYGPGARGEVQDVLAGCIEGLRRGENMVLYPSGHVYHSRLEDLRGNSAVERILRDLPEVRVVLVRTTGLWGSAFSMASGRVPNVAKVLRRGLLSLLAGGVFFAPRRRVDIELQEPADLPRSAGRKEINQYLQDFYNRLAPPNTYVPYSPWERGGVRQLPEPEIVRKSADLRAVSETTRKLVTRHLREFAAVDDIRDDQDLAGDLGMDSLARTELLVWIESEFGCAQSDVDSIRTVADVLLAASGEAVSARPVEIVPPPARWFRTPSARRAIVPNADTITGAFLAQARRTPSRAIIADQVSGVKTYRDLIVAVQLLRRHIVSLPGERVGILLPASVAATTIYLAALFTGKTPVMINWTPGRRNLEHSLESAQVESIMTSRRLTERLVSQGTDLSFLASRMVALEDLAAKLSTTDKLRAVATSRLGWASLRKAPVSTTAAILFTSGSEALPKGVPLSHANILANLRAIAETVELRTSDCMMSILPPFHSFGLTVNVVAPLVLGIRSVYHPNPMESWAIGRLVEAYGATLLVGTPTFLGGIVRASERRRLESLRLAVTGAEACPRRVHDAIAEKCERMTVLEGYGATECSPIISVNDEHRPRPGTIGRVLPSLEYALVDVETNRRVAKGERGMLLVRGPSVFDGYLGGGETSPFVEFESKKWYRTGDLVSEDADGVLTFRGRLKRFVKVGGEMISLPAIEAALDPEYPPGEDGTPVIAVTAIEKGERPEIVLAATFDLDRAEVNRLVREAGFSPLHNVARVVRLDEIPTLGTGKTDYRRLAELI